MSVMMKVYKNDQLFGQCDAKCYNSKTHVCDCVCNGMLHGKGRNNAVCLLRKYKWHLRQFYGSDDGFRIDFF